ncbi:Uncharacterised protein [uncultured archaeon]|nr:Uncharacterised protein [uncultured archaeon]
MSNRQIDVSILTEKGIALLELKSIKGKVIGNENGDWSVIVDTGEEILLNINLFKQLKHQKFAFLEKLNLIRKGNFEHIEEGDLAYIKCWGYFEKDSIYDIEQIGGKARSWFDVITGDNLIEKMRFLRTGYRPKDMDVIVKGLNLKEYSFEKHPYSQEKRTFESNCAKELNVFIPPQNWDKILNKIKVSNIITIVGDRNVGKTTTMMNLAKELKKSGFKVHEDKESLITLRTEKDRTEYYDLIRKKNLFILDDLFGKTEYESGLGNKWIYLIIDILDLSVNQSKIIIGSRRDIIDKFLYNNNELSRWNLMNEFKSSIVELRFSDYDEDNRKEMFDKNLNFIHLTEKNKETILNRNVKKITNELLLPGDISYFIQNAKDKVDFKESELDTYIDKAKQQIHSIAVDIKLLKDYEKIFLYNLYINQDFNLDDLETTYLLCCPSDLTGKNYFRECKYKFNDRFIKSKIEKEFFSDKEIIKLDFVHPVYREAIEKLLKEVEHKSEYKIFNEIIFNLYYSLSFQIEGWNKEGYRYSTLRFNIFKGICYTGHEETYNLVLENLNEISKSITIGTIETLVTSLKSYLGEKISTLEEFHRNFDKFKYYAEFLNNYKKFDDKIIHNYLEKQIQNKDENPFVKYVIAYTMTFEMDSKSIKEIEFLLDKFERDSNIDLLITIFIIKYHKELQESGKTRLSTLNNKNQQIRLLIQNYNEVDETLKNVLENLVSNSEEEIPIEAIPQVLMNFNTLPEVVKNKYAFIFESSDENIKNKIKESLELWVDRYVKDLDNGVTKWQGLDEKVQKLFILWLEKGNYSKQLYGYPEEFWIDDHSRLLYKWIFYSLRKDAKTCFVDKDNCIYIIDIAPSASAAGLTFEEQLTFKEKITHRLREQIPVDLLNSIQVNIISLLKTLKPTFFLCWNNIPISDSSKLITFFGENGVKWENNKTKITNDGQKITISDGESSYSIHINDEKNIVTIKDDLYKPYIHTDKENINHRKSVETGEPKEAEPEWFGPEGGSKQIYGGMNWFSIRNENGRINLYKPPLEKAEVMWVAFLLADKDKKELAESIIKAIEEDKTVLKAFFGACEHFYEYPFKLSDFQEELLNRMLQYSNAEIDSDYDRFCDQRNRSDVNIEDYN